MIKTKKQKADELSAYVADIVSYLVHAYIKHMSKDDSVNKEMLDITEQEWGRFVYKINSTQKNIVLSHTMFRNVLAESLQELNKTK
jgi:hypothetical protein